MEGVVKLRSSFVNPAGNFARAGEEDVAEDQEATALPFAKGILRRKAFYFQQRTGKLDMRSVGRVDIGRIVKEVDVETLQAHLETITFCDLTDDDLRLYSDDCFLKLFQLAQLSIEYLLHVQDTLAAGLETLAAKHGELATELGHGRSQYRQLHEAARALKREVRQKRRTIHKYEQLLAVAPLRGPLGGSALEEHHTCLACGKLFTSAAFLQQHISRKHGNSVVERTHDSEAEAEERRLAEEAARFPELLDLFVQLAGGQCLELSVRREASGRQLRDYVNASAGTGTAAVGGGRKLVWRGVLVQDDRTLLEQRIPTGSTLLVVDTEPQPAGNAAEAGDAAGANAAAAAVAAAAAAASDNNASSSRQLATLVGLMQQQLQWSMQRDESRVAQTLDASEALERRMREMEASLPRRLEGLLGGELSTLAEALRTALHDARGLATRGSNAGELLDDDEDGRKAAELAAKVAQYERELRDLRGANEAAAAAAAAAAGASSRRGSTQTQREEERDGPWLLVFEAEGARPRLEVQVLPGMKAQHVSELLAALLDVDPARVCLRDVSRGMVLSPDEPGVSLRRMRRGPGLVLELLDPQSLLTDQQVDDLVDIYDRSIPREARQSRAVQSSLAEMERVARSRSPRFLPGGGAGRSGRRGSLDSAGGGGALPAEEDVAAVRRELAEALSSTFSRSPGAAAAGGRFHAGVSDGPASPEDLLRSIELRRAARPLAVERRMERVRAAADEALSRSQLQDAGDDNNGGGSGGGRAGDNLGGGERADSTSVVHSSSDDDAGGGLGWRGKAREREERASNSSRSGYAPGRYAEQSLRSDVERNENEEEIRRKRHHRHPEAEARAARHFNMPLAAVEEDEDVLSLSDSAEGGRSSWPKGRHRAGSGDGAAPGPQGPADALADATRQGGGSHLAPHAAAGAGLSDSGGEGDNDYGALKGIPAGASAAAACGDGGGSGGGGGGGAGSEGHVRSGGEVGDDGGNVVRNFGGDAETEVPPPNPNWNRTAETNISVPDDPMSRADEHERAGEDSR